MTINLTLVAQAVNFFIAYILLDRVFLRYGVAVIQSRDKELTEHEQEIVKGRQLIKEKKEHADNQWREFKRRLHKEQPSLKRPVYQAVPSVAQYVHEPSLSPEEVCLHAHDVARVIVRKVVHD